MDRGNEDLGGWGCFPGVGLTSLATLMFQVALTRIFSVSLWHHLAFMVVSIAFLGYGASGTLLMLAPKTKALPLRRTSSQLTFALSMAVLLSYWSSNQIPFDPARFMWDPYQWVYLSMYYGILAVPFFLAGLTLALVYTQRSRHVGRIYAWDLGGAGLGSLGTLWLYAQVGEAGAVVTVSIMAGIASLAFWIHGWRMNLARGLWLGLLCLCLVAKPGMLGLRISPYKASMVALKYPGARLLETQWDGATRLDIIESGGVRFAPGLSLEFQGRLPDQLGLCIDAGSLNAATHFTGNKEDLIFADFLPAAMAYVMVEANDVLVMEPMGGLDLLIAHYHGARNIVTTHASPLVLHAMRSSLSGFSGHLYDQYVIPVKEQARSFLLRAPVSFDVIQLPLTNSAGAVSSGLYGLSEDYTLTVDAFKTYLGALRPGGVLAVTQYLLPPPRHEIRLVGLACEALEAMGVSHPERHLGAIRSWGAFTLVVKRSPLEQEDIRRMKAFCRGRRFDLVHYPNMPRADANQYNRFPGPLYYDMVQKVLAPERREAFYQTYLFDVRPLTDDRPFFHHSFRLDKIVPLYRAAGNKWPLFLEGGYLVHLIFFQALLIGLVLIALPLKKTGRPSSSWFLLYFGLIGVAFMLTEICLIQRFILFLARPAYAFSVVVFSLLFASALGSHHARACLGRPLVLVLNPVLILAYALCLDRLLGLAIGWPPWMRYGATFFLILPLGFMMGMFFPAGIRTLRGCFEGAVPWAWSVNGCASVAGAVLAAVLAVSCGFKMVLCLAALAYTLALGGLVVQNLAHHGHEDYP